MNGNKTLMFFAILWSAITLLFDGLTIVPSARDLLATRYSTTTGTILSGEITQHEDEDGTSYGVQMAYTFSVNGIKYTASRYCYNKWSSCDYAWARDVIADNPVGKQVPVFYNPANPGDAVLATGIHGSDLFIFTFMTPFNCTMLFLWWTCFAKIWRYKFKPLAGGVKILGEPRRIRARLTAWTPLGAILGTVGLLSFFTIFILGPGYGGHPPMRLVLGVWATILASGFIAGAWQQHRILTGKYDLILDQLNSTLELPLTHGRKNLRRIPFQRIQNLRVETVTRSSGEGESKVYVPTLDIEGDTTHGERLVEWSDEAKARSFVEWLRGQLPRNNPKPQRALARRF